MTRRRGSGIMSSSDMEPTGNKFCSDLLKCHKDGNNNASQHKEDYPDFWRRIADAFLRIHRTRCNVCLYLECEMKVTKLRFSNAQQRERRIGNNCRDFPEEKFLIASLKTSIKNRDLIRGSKIHADVLGRGLLGNNVHIGSLLISLYTKCDVLTKAQEVFDQLHIRDVVSWTVLISAYVQCGHSKDALNCYDQMGYEGVSPNAVTCLCILKACGIAGAAGKGEEIHSQIIRDGMLERNILLGTALIDMYCKVGAVTKAHGVLDGLEVRDVISWTSLIGGYAQHGHSNHALCCFEQLQCEGYLPNSVTFLGVLKSCGSIRSTNRGQNIHAMIIKEGLLEKDISLGNALIDMYGKCGALMEAQLVFDELPVRNIISWTALIGGYAEHGYGKEALNCLDWMQHEGFSPDGITFVCALRACGSIVAAEKGRHIHAEIDREGFLRKDVSIGNALVDMYAKCGAFLEARELFDNLPVQDTVSWTVLISGYVQHGHGEEALNCFIQMKRKDLSLNKVTYLSILKACGIVGAVEMGQEIHAEVVRVGFLKNDVLIGNAVVDMYLQCGLLAKAQEVFDNLPVKNIVSWTALIAGYAQHDKGDEALACFEHMKRHGFSPDAVTFMFVLKACGMLGLSKRGEEIHLDIAKEGLLEKDVLVANAVIDMYAKCGELGKARGVFDGLTNRTVVSWTSLISGYVQNGYEEKALEYFDKMQQGGLSPNEVTLLCSLKACSNLGAINKGIEIHNMIAQDELHKKYMSISNALVDMYAKCGELQKAQKVFDELPHQDIVCWTALMAGYALHGKDAVVMDMWKEMIAAGIQPSSVTFTVVLNACTHAGVLDLGQIFFLSMNKDYGISQTVEQYACMVDLFARAGHLDEALVIIMGMPNLDCLLIWTAFLGACQKWGNVEAGRLAFDHARQCSGNDSALYVCMSNIYASAAMAEDSCCGDIQHEQAKY